MEIKNFITFKKIVEVGSFTRAAEELGYAQSSISTHIKDIEDYYGVQLFERIGRDIKLTSFGEQLLHYVSDFIAGYEKLQNYHPSTENIRGHLRIGAPESLMMYRLHHIVYWFKQKYPNVEIIIESDLCPNLRNQTAKGYYDISILLQPLVYREELHLEPLKEEDFCIIAQKGHPIPITPTDNELILFTEKECTYRDDFVAYLLGQGIPIANTLETGSVEAIKKYVTNGLGIAYVPRYTIQEEIKANSITWQPYKGHLNFMTQVVYRKQKNMSPALSLLIEMIKTDSLCW